MTSYSSSTCRSSRLCSIFIDHRVNSLLYAVPMLVLQEGKLEAM